VPAPPNARPAGAMDRPKIPTEETTMQRHLDRVFPLILLAVLVALVAASCGSSTDRKSVV
jgi:hypothetical protein